MPLKRLLVVALAVALLVTVAGCGAKSAAQAPRPASRAVYLTPVAGGSITASDLAAHPEVVVVHDQAGLRSSTTTGSAIWIDKAAVDSASGPWLKHASFEGHPIAVIGVGSALYAFWDLLGFGGSRPQGSVTAKDRARPGFAVWMVIGETATSMSATHEATTTAPTVNRVLRVCDEIRPGSKPRPSP